MAGEGKRNKELLTQQVAAILEFLRRKDLDKAASKLKKQLEKDGFKFPDEDDELEGHWEWVEEEEKEDSSSEEEEEEEEEEDSSSEEESDSDDDESETEEESSDEEEEEESDDESEEEEVLPKRSKKKNGKSDGKTAAEIIESGTDANDKSSSASTTPGEVPNGKSVSFSDEVEERTLSPWKKGMKKELFFSKNELRQFKMEAQEEKLKEQMAQASAAFGVALPGI